MELRLVLLLYSAVLLGLCSSRCLRVYYEGRTLTEIQQSPAAFIRGRVQGQAHMLAGQTVVVSVPYMPCQPTKSVTCL